jgi:hypothetical protein
MKNKSIVIVSAVGLVGLGLLVAGSRTGYQTASVSANYRPPATGPSVQLAQNTAPAPPERAANGARIAVVHAFTLQVPGGEIETVYLRHLDECARLGCVVVGSHLDRSSAGVPYANASIRLAPASFPAFEKALTAAPVRIVTHAQSADDKAIAFLDLEKRIDAKAALRDRLMAMLKDARATTTTDLLAVEKELTQVQADIEAATAQRDYLRTITETVRADISYTAVVAQQGAADLYAAQFKQTFLQSAGALIGLLAGGVTLLAGALPWIPLLIALAWGTRRILGRRPRARA